MQDQARCDVFQGLLGHRGGTTFPRQRGLPPHVVSLEHLDDFQLPPRDITDGTRKTSGQ